MPQIVGTRQVIDNSLPAIASSAYQVSSLYTPYINHPLDAILELTVNATAITPGGDKQVIVYAIASFDGTIWQSGPVSGVDDTRAEQLTRLGALLIPTSAVHTMQFPIGQIFGWLPPYIKFIFKNACGVTIPIGTSVSIAEITGA